jgi:hypothetical protein
MLPLCGSSTVFSNKNKYLFYIDSAVRNILRHKRMSIIGLPHDVIELVRVWLMKRSYYVSIGGENSCFFDLLLGTVQGSVLGPVLYAIYLSPLFDIMPVLSCADDSYNIKSNVNKNQLIKDMEKSLESITKWLKKSGLKVNNAKTDLCLFYKNNTTPIVLSLGDSLIRSKSEINVLGLVFDTKPQWSNHVATIIKKASRALNAIKLIENILLLANYFPC